MPPTSDPTVEVVSEMEDLRVLKNQPAEFICQYTRPVKAQWKKDGQPLQPDGRRVLVEQDWNVARLYISHVSAEDGGTYSCEAEGTRVVASLYVEGELPSTWRPRPPRESPLLPCVPDADHHKACALPTLFKLPQSGFLFFFIPFPIVFLSRQTH